LDKYQEIFQDPKKLPLERAYDHTILLLPMAIPVNAWPYRYSPLHKDEIERQVREMLIAGLIIPKYQPFCISCTIGSEERCELEVLCRLQKVE